MSETREATMQQPDRMADSAAPMRSKTAPSAILAKIITTMIMLDTVEAVAAE